MAKWISKHEPLSLRLTVYGVSPLLLLVSLSQLLAWYDSPASWGRPVVVILFIATAYGLFRMMSWARRTAVAMLWVLVFVLVGGVINPYFASDMMAPPPVTTLLIMIAPAVAAILLCLHLLGKHKACFR